jgi:hypothetical protein
LITADQVLAHAVGDYILQSDWMARQKVKHTYAALCHVATYTLPFLLLTRSPPALIAIAGSHFLVDRYRLSRYVVWAKNWLGTNRPWRECAATGYQPERPEWLDVWLLIIVDNIMHITCNGLALAYLA